MKYNLQVLNGCFNNRIADAGAIIQRLAYCFDYLDVSSVIMGWGIDTRAYEQVGEYTHAHGKKFFLWLPVFAELEEVADAELIVDYRGKSACGVSVQKGENFLFGCPRSQVNHRLPLQIFEEYFDVSSIDGLLLDKVRYPSFGNGFASALGCFCGKCRAGYEGMGVDTERLQWIFEQGDRSVFLPDGLEDMAYTFKEPLIQKFFSARAATMTQALRSISASFKEKGLQIAYDTFAPFAAYFVGQDLEAMAGQADYIKPMLYRESRSPAGMPYEYQSLVSELGGSAASDFDTRFRALHGFNHITDDVFLTKQLRALAKIGKVSPGIEINWREPDCYCTPEYVKNSLHLVAEAGFESAVLSWDVVSAPLENIKILKEIG